MDAYMEVDGKVGERVEKETFRPLARPEEYGRVEDSYGRG